MHLLFWTFVLTVGLSERGLNLGYFIYSLMVKCPTSPSPTPVLILPPPSIPHPTPSSPLRRYLCHWFWHLMYVSNVCILAFLIRNRLSRIILAFVVSLLIFRIVPMSKLLNTSHRASVRLFMWHVYFWLSFSLFHWYSNCPLHHTSCFGNVFVASPITCHSFLNQLMSTPFHWMLAGGSFVLRRTHF